VVVISEDDLLQELLDRWEMAWTKGTSISAEELCRDNPDLLGKLKVQIQELLVMNSLLKSRQDSFSSPRGDSTQIIANHQNLAAGQEPVSGYRLISRLGGGGFGEVWKATGPGGFTVAFKFVKLDGKAGALEIRALDAIKDIRHANLLPMFGAWESNGLLAIAMELADRTLFDRFQQAKAQNLTGIPGLELLEYLSDAANGIDFLNTSQTQSQETVGILHRDIKPQNLLLVGGRVKVADFGLARILDQSVASHTGSLTPAYAAPEFFDGKTHRHSDQYSLAITYCFLRGGRLPFEGNAAQMMSGHLRRSPDLTMLIEEERPVVARALAKDPTQRWTNCRTFVAALRDCQKPVQTKVNPRRRWRLIGICFVLLVGALVLASSLSRDKEKDQIAVQAQQIDGSNPGQTDDANPESMGARDFLERGNEFFDKKDYDNAIADYTEAVRREPMLAEAYGYRARTYEAKGEHDLAISDSNSAIKLEPELFIAYHTRGLAFLQKKHFLSAINDFTKAIQLSPKSTHSFYGRGNACSGINDYNNSIKDYTEAIRLDPIYASAYRARSDAYSRQGKKDLATKDLMEAQRLEKEHPGSAKDSPPQPEQDPKKLQAAKDHFNRGLAYSRSKTYDKAVVEMTEAFRLDPENPFYLKNRGIVYRASGNLDRAIADFSEAIRLRPDYETAMVERGITYASKKDYDRAIADYTRAIQIRPIDTYAFEKRSQAYASKGEKTLAQADHQEAQRLKAKK
jgi:tetratricopeptide (TPR) repeat protein/serine/threonine protein kinase